MASLTSVFMSICSTCFLSLFSIALKFDIELLIVHPWNFYLKCWICWIYKIILLFFQCNYCFLTLKYEVHLISFLEEIVCSMRAFLIFLFGYEMIIGLWVLWYTISSYFKKKSFSHYLFSAFKIFSKTNLYNRNKRYRKIIYKKTLPAPIQYFDLRAI